MLGACYNIKSATAERMEALMCDCDVVCHKRRRTEIRYCVKRCTNVSSANLGDQQSTHLLLTSNSH